MKSILTGILSFFIFFGTVPNLNASDMKMDNMEEVKEEERQKEERFLF